MVKIYGIKNCDTMKKAFKWLDENDVSYDFHDYKKQGADADVLTRAIAAHGWDSVINKRGTSWRKLDANTQSAMSDESAVQAARENPSLIKRPLLIHDDTIYLGFKDEAYKEIFGL